jgi:hypothetical protein
VLDFAVHDVDSSLVLTFPAKAKPPIAVVFELGSISCRRSLGSFRPRGGVEKDLSFCLIDSHVAVRAEEARKGVTQLAL